MKERDVILVAIPQANGALKNRPALLLRELPAFGHFLVCGISTQLHQAISGFDEVVSPSHSDFGNSGLLRESLIRLGFLAVVPKRKVLGSIGSIDPKRHARLLRNLSGYLTQKVGEET